MSNNTFHTFSGPPPRGTSQNARSGERRPATFQHHNTTATRPTRCLEVAFVPTLERVIGAVRTLDTR